MIDLLLIVANFGFDIGEKISKKDPVSVNWSENISIKSPDERFMLKTIPRLGLPDNRTKVELNCLQMRCKRVLLSFRRDIEIYWGQDGKYLGIIDNFGEGAAAIHVFYLNNIEKNSKYIEYKNINDDMIRKIKFYLPHKSTIISYKINIISLNDKKFSMKYSGSFVEGLYGSAKKFCFVSALQDHQMPSAHVTTIRC